MEQKLCVRGTLGAQLIRGDGYRKDFGIISAGEPIGVFSNLSVSIVKLQRRSFWRRLWLDLRARGVIPFGLGFTAFLARYALTGESLSSMDLPMLAIVTNAGVNYMASDFASGGVTPTISGFKFHDSGTGTTAAAVGDTALQTPAGPARVTGTPSNPTANQYRSVATIAYTATLAITEWGLFSASTAGTLWDRRVFTAINVVNGDSIQFTYTLTIASGGT